MELNEIDEIFTKDMYLQYLNRAYNNMYADKVIVKSDKDDDYFIIKMTFSYKKTKINNIYCYKKENSSNIFNIHIPHNFNELQFITYLLSILTKTRLKHLLKISVKLCRGNHLKCFNYIINRDGIYNFDTNVYDNEDTHYWNNIRHTMILNYTSPNKEALNAILQN